MVNLDPISGSLTYFCMDSKQSLDQGILPGFVSEAKADGRIRFEEEVEEACGPESHSETSRANYFLRRFGSQYQVLKDASIVEFSHDKLWRTKENIDMPSVIQFLMSKHFAVLLRISAAKFAEAKRNGMGEEEVKLRESKFDDLKGVKQIWDSQRECNTVWNLVRTKLREKTQQMKFEEKLDMDPEWFPCKRETKDESGNVVNESGWEVNWKTGLCRERTAQSMWTYESPAAIPSEMLFESKTNSSEFCVDSKKGIYTGLIESKDYEDGQHPLQDVGKLMINSFDTPGKYQAMQRWFGCCLTIYIGHKHWVFIQGDTNAGKSAPLRVVKKVLANADTTITKGVLFKMKEGQANSHSSHLVTLEKKRSLTFVESENDFVINGTTSKIITGDDDLALREAYSKKERTIRVVANITVTSNHPPVFDGSDKAMATRNLIVKMKRKFVKPVYDQHGELIPLTKENERYMQPELVYKLESTDAGMNQVFAWLVCGAMNLSHRKMNFGWPADVVAETDAYNKKMDTVAGFVEEYLVIHQARDYEENNELLRGALETKTLPLASTLFLKDTYNNYKKYCRDHNLHNIRPISEFKVDIGKLGCFINKQIKVKGVNKRIRGLLFELKGSVYFEGDEPVDDNGVVE